MAATDDPSRQAVNSPEAQSADAIDPWQLLARERRQIAFDLHDGLLQQIIGAGMLLEALKYRIVGGHVVAEQDIQPIASILDSAVREGRAWIRQLENNDLEAIHNLRETLLSLINQIQKRTQKITIATEIAAELPDWNNSTKSHIVSIVREALANTLKHSRGQHAWVRLHPFPNESQAKTPSTSTWILEIQDDGRGIDMQELWDLPLKDHFGMTSLKHRAIAIGGTLEIETKPQQGTLVRVKFREPPNVP